jgi:hypothetical protein
MAVVFSGRVRRWREDRPGGLAVVDVPSELVDKLGRAPPDASDRHSRRRAFCWKHDAGRRRRTMRGVSGASLKAAGATVGDDVELSTAPAAVK